MPSRLFRGMILSVALIAAGCSSGTTTGTGGSSGSSASSGASSGGSSGTSGVHTVALAVSPATGSLAAGTTLALHATLVTSDGNTQDVTATATWSSSDESVITVDAAGVATAVAAGTATITASANDATGSASLTATSATLQAIQVTGPSVAIALGTTEQLTATGVFSDNSTQDLTSQVAWSSSATGVATVDDSGTKGLVTAVAAGPATITATDTALSKSGSLEIAVTDAQLVSLEVLPDSPTIAAGTSQQFTATGHFSDGSTQDLTSQVSWDSDADAVATISPSGLATSSEAGPANISATLDGIVGTTQLTVSSAVLIAIDIAPASATLAKGTSQPLVATGTFSDATTQDLTASVSWTSSDDGVATVSNTAGTQGQITAVAAGSATITATDPATSVFGSASVDITNATLVSIAVSAPTTDPLPVGATLPLTATGSYSDGSTADITSSVTWSTSDDSQATVSNATGSRGVVTGVGAGTPTLTATDPLTQIAGSTSVEVGAAVISSITVIPNNGAAAKGTTQAFTAMATLSDNSSQDVTSAVTWASSDTSVAAFSTTAGSENVASALAAGATTITATDGTVVGSATFNVTSAALTSIAVTANSATIAAGTSEQFVATGTYSDSTTQDITSLVTWASSDPAVSISNTSGSRGVATGVAAGGPSSVSATDPSGNISGSFDLTVSSASLVSIEVSPNSASIAQNETQQFTAAGTFSDGSTQDVTNQVTWSATAGIADISNTAPDNGKATGVGAGNATVNATLDTITSNSATLDVAAKALVSIAVTPSSTNVVSGSPVQLTATGTYNDGSTANLTATATWFSGNTSVVTVSNAAGTQGVVTYVGRGSTTVAAILGGLSGTAAISSTERVLIVAASGYASDVKTKLQALGAFSLVDLFDAAAGTPTLAQLQGYDAVLVFSDSSFNDSTTLGNNLASYWDGGGVVVIATFAEGESTASLSPQGTWGVPGNGYVLLNGSSQTTSGGTSITINDPSSALMTGVRTLTATNAFHIVGTLVNGAVTVASWANGDPLVIAGTKSGRKLCALNFYPPSSAIRPDFWNGDGAIIMENALYYR